MSKRKILSIAAKLLGILCAVFAFSLSRISEAFTIVGGYCGIGAISCLLIYLDLKNEKGTGLILAGTWLLMCSYVLMIAIRRFLILNRTLAALYMLTGLLTLIRGIRARRAEKRKRNVKKPPVNIKMILGICLFFGSILVTVLLFYIHPMLMCIGYVIMATGLVLWSKGFAQWKNEFLPVTFSTLNSGNAPCCARCNGYIQGSTYTIGEKQYCLNCKKRIDEEKKVQHTICSVCGVDLPMEYMHTLEKALVCHKCFLEKCQNMDFYEQGKDLSQ